MKFQLIKCTLISLLLMGFVAYSISGQTINSATDRNEQPLHLLVLGDSVIWGQGLRTEHKTWYHVKVWLEKTTGRAVLEKVVAHSGAIVESSPTPDRFTATDAEVNVALPTLNDELDAALRFYSDSAQIDLVLISGCANDVGAENLLNANATDEIDEMTKSKCGAPMERLLRRVTTSFPAARVILTGYYPFFSERTKNDFILKGLVRRFLKIIPGTPKLKSKQVLERLTANSSYWYDASNKTLAQAVRNVNAELGDKPERVVFAKIEFPSEYSFAAPRTRLWEFDRSPFKMILLVLSFGKVPLPSNDDVRKQRSASCKQVFKEQANETILQKKDREKRRSLCRYAALGHPNRSGALVYAEVIKNLLKDAFSVPASVAR